MKSVYRALAYLVALEVVVQAGAIAFAMFGLVRWIDDGGVLDQAAIDSGSATFTGVIGFPVHAINGQMVIPLIALLLVIASFFAKVPGGVLWAGLVLLTVVVQVLLGIFAHGAPELGVLHGVVAIALFAFAVMAARRAEGALGGLDRSTAARGTAGVA
jgi:hypothetical protein